MQLIQLLEEQTWPGPYTFKFVVPKAQVKKVLALFPDGLPTLRESSKGNYLSVTARLEMDSAQAVMALYEEAATISGIVSL